MTEVGDNWSSENSCQKVRDSCRAWMKAPENERLVQIHSPSLTNLAQDILSEHQTSSASIEWDEEGWHYQPDARLPARISLERLALFILAMDAINFCFWPSHVKEGATNFEYEHLAMAMAGMAREDEVAQLKNPISLSSDYVFSPARLANMTLDEMTKLWDTHLAKLAADSTKNSNNKQISKLDNLETRCQLWKEVGQLLLNHWEGSILKFLAIQEPSGNEENATFQSALSAPQLVDRIVDSFPGFRDCHATTTVGAADHAYLCLYKRAQICVGDWNASLRLQLTNLDQVTTFADYRVPQLLRHAGVLQYASSLADSIDRGEEIEKDSPEELTIRAATVVAVEDLVQELHRQQQQASDNESKVEFTAVSVDWYLWQAGEKMNNEGTLKPHHKTRTTFY
ncbi:Queuosine salvage protein [Seminavis robusta]|uniref:Queuosine 5'-phosphate N-glycosylase/hydrolase n=1 Tax=Seminavis robusta TaxID=568900 RepID=A0A9N8EK75_9STRA|nr:Queuosine salvage protein [Seminavis robusta]|eukprot:Sro1210_g252800.1 Queuosine salvage protein (398) ;mRNA; r:28208-29401